jgi:NTE family protein
MQARTSTQPGRRRRAAPLILGILAMFAAHEVGARPTVGLVLSGGGARGGAHVGVIRVLEDLNVPVDYIAGTSMGAVVGGLYAAGLTADELEEVVRTSDWNVLLRDRPPRPQRPYRRKSDDLSFLVDFDLGIDSTGLLLPGGLVQGQNMDLALRRLTLPVATIDDFDALPIPFRSVATDIGSGEMVVFDSGDLVVAMHASMAVPGIFKPQPVDGRLLVDGGISSNLPIEIMREMGADVIIAVDLGFPLQPQEKLGSALAITSQMITILINSRAADQLRFLREDDIHITPDLGELGSQEFDRLAEAMEIGRRDAARHAGALAQLSITDAAYRAYRAELSRRRGEPAVVDDVRVVNDSGLSPKVIESRLSPLAGKPVEIDELERDIADIYALDAFESVTYDLHREDAQTTLEIRSTAKQWGPNYIRFGINLEEDFQGGSNYNVATRLTMTEMNPLGGEFRTEFQVGESPRLFAEFFQPLDYRSRWFINPKLELRRTSVGLFDDGIQLAQLSSSQASVALEGGRQFGHWGELRVGVLRLRSDESLLIGEPGLESGEGNLGAWLAQLAYDTIDQVDIPLHGTLAAVAWNGSRQDLGSDGDFDVASVFLLKPVTWGRNTLLNWWNLDATLRDDTAGIQPFTLGGPFSLSGYATGELRGKHRGIGRLLYYRRLGDDRVSGLDNQVYLGFSLEAGNVWESREAITLDNTLTAGSLFVVFDTLLGPLYLGYGMGEDDRRSAFLYLGQTF